MNEENRKYKDFIKQYLTEQGVDFSCYETYKPLYLRYRARCLKMKPDTYQAFLNLCCFESTRANTKYDMHANLLEGKHKGIQTEEEKEQKRNYRGTWYTRQQASMNYKLNYKAPPKKEDFEFPMEWRKAYLDWSYLKAELADYEAVKAVLNKPTNKGKPDRIPNEGCDMKRYHYMFEFPYLIRYALKCLGGTYPIECFPESLNDYRQELQELLNKQRNSYNQEPLNFPWEVGKWIL